jgi:hypothetical protein
LDDFEHAEEASRLVSLESMALDQSVSVVGPGLKRILGLPALILDGIILIEPTAPMPLFGVAAEKAGSRISKAEEALSADAKRPCQRIGSPRSQ